MKLKKYFCVILIVVLFLSACQFMPTNTSPDSELPDSSFYRQQDSGEFFIETADYYYYLYNKMIYVSAKSNPAFYYLCSKPDCPHGGRDCNAYGGCAIGYWNGHLYSALLEGETPSFVQMDLDGSNHKEVAEIVLPLDANGSEGGSYSFYFHNGGIFYDVRNTSDFLFYLDLKTGETKPLLKDILGTSDWLTSDLRFSGEQLILSIQGENGIDTLYTCDIPSGEAKKVENFSSFRWIGSVEGDMLYYYDKDRSAFCEYNLTTKEEKITLKLDYSGGAAYYDSEYIYLRTWDDDDSGNKGLSIFDRNYQFIQRIELRGNLNFIYDAQDKLIFTDLPSQKATKYLPKSAIGTGEAELLPIEDPYSYR